MQKELKITLKDEDATKWGPHECALRLLMAKHNAPYALIPHIDENSSRSERDYMCEQLLKEYRNRISSVKENQPVQLTKQEQDVIITNLLAKIVIASAMVTMILLILFT